MNTTAMAKACLAAATALQQLAAALEAELPAAPAPPASVAEREVECGCDLYARCERHEAERHRTCKCNGPRFASSNCPLTEHRQVANVYPDRDPARLD